MKHSIFIEERVIDTNCIIRIRDVAVIPDDEGNVDYQEYLAWIEEGNEPIPFDQLIFDNQFAPQQEQAESN
jgi:hypothetical protein